MDTIHGVLAYLFDLLIARSSRRLFVCCFILHKEGDMGDCDVDDDECFLRYCDETKCDAAVMPMQVSMCGVCFSKAVVFVVFAGCKAL